MARIRVVGRREPLPPPPDLGALRDLGGTAENVKAVQVGAARAGATAEELDGLADDTIVELTLDTGARFYHRYDQLKQDLPRWATRGGGGDADTIELPLVLPGALTRGGRGESAIETVRTFDLDLAGAFGKAAGGLSGRPLAEKLDDWLLKPKSQGLRRWSPTSGVFPDDPILKREDFSAPGPLLLFIHGTGSSTGGSFGAVNASEGQADPWRKSAVDRLAKAYPGRMVAFDHRTLSVSPIQNCIDLLEGLPAGAGLHVISHSRGGMIGELLCRAQRSDGNDPFHGELDALKRWADARRRDYTEEFKLLTKLEKLLKEQRPKVERFVRVACPAAGTTLASGRLDIWLSTATSVLDLTGLGLSPTYQFLKGFLLAVVKSRTDPRQVPGLEAMLPNSLLTMILNRPGVETSADLSVISGDIEGAGRLAKLGLKVLDWFYGGDHDLIVDTVSMYGGLARANRGARFFFDKGSEVNHFGYFRNRKTLEKLVDGLARADGNDAGFDRLAPAQEISDFLSARRAAGPRPAVFLLPDLMGSHLSANGERVWIDAARIARGELGRVAFGAPGITADALVADAYGPLAEHLSASHEVKPFAYDWRLSLIDNGRRFAGELRNAMTDGGEPVRVVAHGAGGLLALAALAENEELRRDFAARKGARLLLLGTSRRGSAAIVRLLLGHDRLIQYLAMLDLRPDAQLAEIFRAFPGVLELLPDAAANELFQVETWQSLLADSMTQPPDAQVLAQAREARGKLANLRLEGFPLAWVGAADALMLTMQIAGNRARFFAHPGGDREFETEWPKGTVWWVEAQSGELASHTPSFNAYFDLLMTGTTLALQTRSSDRANAPVQTFEVLEDVPPVYPDERELAAAALGYMRRAPVPATPKTELSVIHGNIAFARWPVAVGHYEGDTLNGSEAQLDRALGNRLARRRDLRVYPGPIGTAEILLDQTRSPLGAVVIGIGRVGELTPGELRRTLSRALRRYALAVRETGALPGDQMAISMVFIGTGEGGVGTRDAITAVLQALVRANDALADDAFRIVEFFELYEDRAINAARTLAVILESEEFKDLFSFNGSVKARAGGYRQSAAREDPAWWRRLQVESLPSGELRFTDLTDRARVPVSLVASERKQVDGFIRRAVNQTHAADEFPPSATLFELLLPARVKEDTRNDRHTVVVLDKETARYPWELLRRPGMDHKPLSVRAGMIRQLTESQLPDRPIVAVGNKALVVGDPPTGLDAFQPLPGAREEAKLVAKRLRERFEVREPKDGDNSLSAILCGHWRIMHLAAHGAFQFEKDGERFTGVALENGMFFTPDNVAQMDAIPEFVFLNCCYLGQVDPAAEKRAEARYHELAANMSTAFIKLGAHAVIAAGWAVDDAAAKYFADVFYRRLLQGETFGSATLKARNDIYSRYGVTNNTWGAYQCYGDPSYRLFVDGQAGGTGTSERSYVHIREAIMDVTNVGQDALTAAVREPEPLQKRLKSVVDQVQRTRPEWLLEPELRAAMGQAYGSLGMIGEAIEAYTVALQAEKAAAPIRTIEQLANLRARQAAREGGLKAAETIESSIVLLDNLPRLADDGHTAERWSLLGSCYKRLAQVTAGKKRVIALTQMSRCYKQAFERSRQAPRVNSYPLLNWLLADNLLALLNASYPKPTGLEDWLIRAEAEARAADAEEPSFWNGATPADVALGRALQQGNLHDQQAAVVEAYLKPWRRGASALEFASVLEQIDFLAAVLSGDRGKKSNPQRQKLSETLRATAAQLRAATGVS